MISYDDEHITDRSNLYLNQFPTNVPLYDTYLNTNANVSPDSSGSYNSNFQPSAAVGYDCVLNQEPRTWPVDYYYQSSSQSNDIIHQQSYSYANFNNAHPNQSRASSVEAIEEHLLKEFPQPTVQEDLAPIQTPLFTPALFTPGNSRPLPSPAASMSMPPHPTQVSQVCAICEDKATGKHYGAASCDGCKGFFRRSIRKNQHYQCRFHNNCVVDKDKRNQCRHCRLRKCLRAGMKKEAVQNERDSISCSRKPIFDMRSVVKGMSVMQLKNADMMYFLQDASRVMSDQTSKQAANLDNVYDSIKNELMLIVEWVKSLPLGNEFTTDELMTLLKTCAGEQLILGAARRSVNTPNALLLGNNYVIHRCNASGLAGGIMRQPEVEISRIGTRVLDELVQPFVEMGFDDTEFACLRALMFFDPSAASGPNDRQRVRNLRRQVQMTLEDYIFDHFPNHPRGRFGELMMILPILQSISSQMIEQMQYMNLFGILKEDTVVRFLLLKDIPPVTIRQNPTVPEPTSAVQSSSSIAQHHLPPPTPSLEDMNGYHCAMNDSMSFPQMRDNTNYQE